MLSWVENEIITSRAEQETMSLQNTTKIKVDRNTESDHSAKNQTNWAELEQKKNK